MKRGFIIGLGVIIAGLLLELATGPVVWNLLAWPANIVALGLFVAVIIGLGTLYSKSEIIRWLSSYQAAVPTMIYARTGSGSTICLDFGRSCSSISK